MKQGRYRTIWLVVLFLCVFPAAAAEKTPDAGEQSVPAAVTPEVVRRVADIVEGQRIVHHFPVFNKGAAELLIHNVKAG